MTTPPSTAPSGEHQLIAMARMLDALQEARSRLTAGLEAVRGWPGIAGVAPFVNLSGRPITISTRTGQPAVFDGSLATGVSVDHESGANMCYSVDVRWHLGGCWIVEPQVSFSAPEDGGCRWPVEFEAVTVISADALVSETLAAVDKVLGRLDLLELLYVDASA